jgi:hypothetical protein
MLVGHHLGNAIAQQGTCSYVSRVLPFHESANICNRMYENIPYLEYIAAMLFVVPVRSA